MMIFMHDWEVAALILHLRIEITFYVTFLECHHIFVWKMKITEDASYEWTIVA